LWPWNPLRRRSNGRSDLGASSSRTQLTGPCFLHLSLQAPVFDPKDFAGFEMLRVKRDAAHRADLHALRHVEVAYALGASRRIDLVNLRAHRDGLIRALRFADIAVDAFVRNEKCHGSQPGSVFTRCFNRSSTEGDTNLETSPPKVAISRTNVPETNW
jgi:hypothetical protein